MDRPALGIGLRLLSRLLMAGMMVSVKAVSDVAPLGQIVFFRSAFALIPLVAFLWVRGEFPGGLATRRPVGHLLRASFGALALFASFAAVARLTLAEATLIAELSPILMAAAAALLLAERLTIWRVGGPAFGFVGVVVMVWPELQGAGLQNGRLAGYALGLAATAPSALALIMVRRLNRTDSPGAIALHFVLASMTAALLTLPWGWVAPDAATLALLVAAGLFGGFGHIAMMLAFRFAQASRLAPDEYVALLWPVAADPLIFGAPLSTAFLLAAPLVLLGAGLAAMEGRRARPLNA